MAALYPFAYVGILASVLLWYYRDEKKSPAGFAKISFWTCVLIYAVSFISGDGGFFYKYVLILARDFIVFLVVLLVGHNLVDKPRRFFIALVCIAVMILFFFGKLQRTFDQNLFPLDPKGELLVDLKDAGQPDKVKTKLAEYGITLTKAFPGLLNDSYSELDDYYVIDIPENHDDKVENVIEKLFDTGLVDWVERNEVVKLSPLEKVDPGSKTKDANKKFGLNDPALDKQWAFEKMNMAEYYQMLKKKGIKPKKRAVIAILDTGVDAKHEDLKDNFISTDKKYNTDKVGHGTHCAGIAGAVSNNKIGIASIVPASRFVRVTSIKVLGDNGSGSQKSVIEGIIRAADEGADVLSMSLGGYSNDESQKAYNEAIKYATKSGAIVVVAAGNDNSNAAEYMPAGAKGVITVSAVDKNLKKAEFSNYVNDIKMGIAAPGVSIYSTLPGNKYEYLNGTSMATPYVAGLLGMMKSLKPKLKAEEAYGIVKSAGIKTNDVKATGLFIQPAGTLSALQK